MLFPKLKANYMLLDKNVASPNFSSALTILLDKTAKALKTEMTLLMVQNSGRTRILQTFLEKLRHSKQTTHKNHENFENIFCLFSISSSVERSGTMLSRFEVSITQLKLQLQKVTDSS